MYMHAYMYVICPIGTHNYVHSSPSFQWIWPRVYHNTIFSKNMKSTEYYLQDYNFSNVYVHFLMQVLACSLLT